MYWSVHFRFAIALLGGVGAVSWGRLEPEEIRAQAVDHWAYQPVVVPPVPAGDAHPVDALLAQVRPADSKPAPRASDRVLVRRAWYTVTGLPATFEESEEWAKRLQVDASAHGALVDQLLASPHYGEHIGRLWLDVARYADTKGYVFQEDRAYPYAYTYRDWVIDAFNRDVPYDAFVQRQLAADLLELPVQEHAAMGFLPVGGRFLNRRHLIIDDWIDVTTRGVLASTVACARCHDHFSDPFLQSDYYGLYGIFNSSEELPEGPLLGKAHSGEHYEAFLEEVHARADEVHVYLRESFSDYEPPEDRLSFNRLALSQRFGKNVPAAQEFQRLLREVQRVKATHEGAPPRAMVLKDRATPREPHIFLRGDPNRTGEVVPRAFPVFLRSDSNAVYTEGSGRLAFARELTRNDNPLTARVWANRVWMWVMGKPLVETPSDFGLATPRPKQLALLDHLAHVLVQKGWSTKALIRHIMTSDAWAQRVRGDGKDVDRDPENEWFARAVLRRKSLEGWRDAIVWARTDHQPALFGKAEDLSKATMLRRTIYGRIERQNLPVLFRAFDYPDPYGHSGRRAETVTPTQALTFLNSPLVVQASEHLGERAARQKQPVRALGKWVLGRALSDQEVAEAKALLAQWRSRPPKQNTGPFSFGYGVAKGKGEWDFTPLPKLVAGRWQGGDALPDQTLE